MRSLLLKRVPSSLTSPFFASFSSAHSHDHSLSHAPEVHLNRTKNYLSFQDKKSAPFALFGFTDVNEPAHEEHPADPFAHLREVPLLSLRRFYFSDPFFHEEEHEPLWNTPHGYLLFDDPLDNRNMMDRGTADIFWLGMAATFLLLGIGYASLNFKHPAQSVFEENVTAQLIEDELRKIRKENKALEDRRDALKAKLGR